MGNYNDLHTVCTQVFESVSKAMTVFVLPMLMGRIVFANILGEGSKAFAAIKSVTIYFILVAGFPLFIEILFSIPDSFLPKAGSFSVVTENSSGISASTIPFTLDRIFDVLLAVLYWFAYYLHVFFMLLMCAIAPVVFLVSTLMGVGLGLEVFIGLLIIGSSWPVIWYGFDQVHGLLASTQADEFGAKCLELLVTVFKGLGPLCFSLLAVNSPAGQMLSKATQTGISAGKWTSRHSVSVMRAPGRMYQSFKVNRAAVSEPNHKNLFSSSSRASGFNPAFPDRLKKAREYFSDIKGDRKK